MAQEPSEQTTRKGSSSSGAHHAKAEHPSVVAGAGEGEDAEDGVEQEAGAAAHLNVRHRQSLLHQVASDVGMEAHNEPPDPQRVSILGKTTMRKEIKYANGND